MTENLVLAALLLLKYLAQPLQRVHRHDAGQFALHLQEVGVGAVIHLLAVAVVAADAVRRVGVGGLTLLCSALTQAAACLVDGTVGHSTQTRLLYLTLVFTPDALNLLNINTALHQVSNDLTLRRAFFVLVHDVSHYLFVGHRRLSHHGGAHNKEQG